ncbi:signal peptide peptidase SppA [Bacteroidota bacterium]
MKGFFKYVFASMVGFIFAYILIIIIMFSIVFGTISKLTHDKLGKSDKEVVLKEGSILLIELNQQIVERTDKFPFEELGFFDEDNFAMELKEVKSKILAAKDDPKISGILLNVVAPMASLTSLEDIRNALLDFKSSGKYIWNYSALMSQKAYYIASVADRIILSPEGELLFGGVSSEMIFLKGMFDKLDMQPTLIRAGNYKSAGEMYTRNNMSPYERKQMEEFLFPMYDHILFQIADSRKIDKDSLHSIADNLFIRSAEDALNFGLVDDLLYRDQVHEALKTFTKTENLNFVKLSDYSKSAEAISKKDYTKDKIAVIYAVGAINMGKGDNQSIGAETLTKAIRKAREDENIKAIVLRINSPGGASLPSDLIWREVKLAAEAKPLVVSMGSLAASGGYYIACPADTILAEPNTITGSIGVFGMHINMKDFWANKLGIQYDRIKSGTYSDLMNPNRPMTEEEHLIVQSYVDNIYFDFKKRVAEGRGLEQDWVDSIAQGRIWSGIKAVEIGLVDKIGNLEDAIEIAANMAGLKNYRIKELPKKSSPFDNLPFFSMAVFQQKLLQNAMGEDYILYKQLNEAKRLTSDIYMLLPYQFDIK